MESIHIIAGILRWMANKISAVQHQSDTALSETWWYLDVFVHKGEMSENGVLSPALCSCLCRDAAPPSSPARRKRALSSLGLYVAVCWPFCLEMHVRVSCGGFPSCPFSQASTLQDLSEWSGLTASNHRCYFSKEGRPGYFLSRYLGGKQRSPPLNSSCCPWILSRAPECTDRTQLCFCVSSSTPFPPDLYSVCDSLSHSLYSGSPVWWLPTESLHKSHKKLAFYTWFHGSYVHWSWSPAWHI